MDYFIAHFPRENERAIFKKDDDDAMWLSWNNEWTLDKWKAIRFYHEDSAVWALISIRRWWEIDTTLTRESESEGVKEKTSWSELS